MHTHFSIRFRIPFYIQTLIHIGKWSKPKTHECNTDHRVPLTILILSDIALFELLKAVYVSCSYKQNCCMNLWMKNAVLRFILTQPARIHELITRPFKFYGNSPYFQDYCAYALQILISCNKNNCWKYQVIWNKYVAFSVKNKILENIQMAIIQTNRYLACTNIW